MSFSDERRKGLRVYTPAQMYFNILKFPKEYVRGQSLTSKKLALIDAEKTPQPQDTASIFLSRIDQKLSLLLGILTETNNIKSYAEHGSVIDVSEFGLSFGHNKDYPMGTHLEIGLNLPHNANRLLDIAGKIVRILPENSSNKYTHVYGVEFIDILSMDQNDIVQWIFSKQREEIRRRKDSSENF